MKYFIISFAVLGSVVAFMLIGPESSTPNDDRAARDETGTTITVFEARPAIEVVRIEAVGSAEARRAITLFPASAGEIDSITFITGQRIEQGQLLLSLDARDEQLALELAEARLADARRLLDRYSSAGSAAAFTPNQLDAAEIAVAEARIARDRARVALDDRQVVAPFSGTIGLSELDPGDRVTTNTAIASLDDRSQLLVRFEVPEAYLGQIAPGTEVDMTPWSVSENRLAARVVDVGSRIDPATRTFTVRAALDNSNDRYRPGMGFRVRLDLVGRSYVQVPELALQWGAKGAYIWVVDDSSRARRAAVTLIQRKDGQVLLDGDIAVGQPVVLEGVHKMSDGRIVEVIDDDLLDQRDAVQARLESQL